MIGAVAGAGLGYAAAAPVLDALAASNEAKCLRGRPLFPTGAIALGGRSAWTTDLRATTITARPRPGRARGRSIDVGGAPVDLAIAPDRGLAVVTTAFYDRPGLAIVGLRSGRVKRVELDGEPGAVALTPEAQTAYVVRGGPEGALTRVRPRDGRVERTIPVGSHPRGLALSADGRHAIVALNGERAIAVVELRTMRVHRIRTASFPAAVAITADGRRALVTHDGLAARKVSVVDLGERAVERTVDVGNDPSAIAASRSRVVVVARSGRAVVLDAQGRRLRKLKLGGRPEAVAVAGGSAWIVDGRTGHLDRVHLGGRR